MTKARVLQISEWDRLGEVFEEFGEALPLPGSVIAIVAENGDGKMIGLLCLRNVVLVEPVWLRKELRVYLTGGRALALMIAKAHELMPRCDACFAFTEKNNVARLLSRLCFEPLKHKVYRWVRRKNG